MLHELSRLGADSAQGSALVRRSYQAIGQFRYIDWAITMPLLLLKPTSMLRISPKEAGKTIAALLLADFWMVLTGYIGEQQLTPTGEIISSAKLLWGAVSTLGYLVVPFLLYGLYKHFAARANEHERWGCRFMTFTTVMSWGVYPLGHLLTLTTINLNYIHLAFSVADIFNKTGVAIVAYLVGKHIMDERLDEQKVLDGYVVG